MSISTKKEYFEELDILRFFAFFCVFVSHIFVFSDFQFQSDFMKKVTTYLFTQGNLGVTFFFVLSGFLITYLLFKEKEGKGKISVKKFYMRRVLRIWPVYFAVVFAGFLIIPFLVNLSTYYGLSLNKAQLLLSGTELYRIPWYSLFVANFDMIIHGPAAFFLAVLWSVSVEEQFYLVWPLLLRRVSIKKVTFLFGSLMLVSFLYRYKNVSELQVLRASTFSFLSDLATGAFFAYVVLYKNTFVEYCKKVPSRCAYLLYLLVPLFFVLNKYIELQSFTTESTFFHVLYALFPQILAVFFALCIVFLTVNRIRLFTGKIHEWFIHLGKISYGLYCYHCFGILFTKLLFSFAVFAVYRNTYGGFFGGALISFCVTLLIAELSFKYLEEPILKLKEKFQ